MCLVGYWLDIISHV